MLSLREKIGQLFVCGFYGTEPSPEIRALIENGGLGGVVYFRRNVRDPEQVRRLSDELQRMARGRGLPPLAIAIDQEGGMVSRLVRGVTPMPGAMAIAAARDPDDAYRAARAVGRELRALGITWNFAPCLDVNCNPRNPVIGVRSFGGSPEAVAEFGARQIAGYQDAGVAATAKHFPGHGDTDVDSHLGLPRVGHSPERLERVELAPFRRAVEAGVDAIMTAHVVFPAYEPTGVPATLSRSVLTGCLRERLGFEGLVVTDCLEMQAISRTVGVAEGAVRAIAAGADLVLVSHTYEWQKTAMEAVVEAVRHGELGEDRIERSVERVLRWKERRGMGQPSEDGLETLLAPEHVAVCRRICERAVTMVRDGGDLPLDRGEPVLVVWPEVRVRTEVDEPSEETETLGFWLERAGMRVEEHRVGLCPDELEAESVLEACGRYNQAVLLAYNALFYPEQVRLIRQVSERMRGRPGVRLVGVSVRNPYDAPLFGEIRTFLACYENRPEMMRALAGVLLGEGSARGRLPVAM